MNMPFLTPPYYLKVQPLVSEGFNINCIRHESDGAYALSEMRRGFLPEYRVFVLCASPGAFSLP